MNVSTSSPITYTPRIHLPEARPLQLPAHPISATQSPLLGSKSLSPYLYTDADTVPCDTHRIAVPYRRISAEGKAGSSNGMNAYAYEENLQICGGFIRSTCVDIRTTYVDIWI